MKLTKYEHACVTLEKDGEVLVIDPGDFSSDFVPPEHVVAVVLTHVHGDHFDPDNIAAIVDKNPDARIISIDAVTTQLEAINKQTVRPGETVTVGAFTLEFFGGLHALIHESIPRAENIGVLVNELFYYPGDSFTVPERSVDTLALPVTGPWLKIGEAMDFLLAVKPRFAFPTHDAIADDLGRELVDRLVNNFATEHGVEYQRLTESIEI